MTGPTFGAPAPGNWTPLLTRLLPALVGFLLLGDSAAGAPSPGASSNVPGPPIRGVESREPELNPVSARVPYALDGRSRFEIGLGLSDVNVSDNELTDVVNVTGGAVSLVFVHWVHENLAVEVSLGASNIGVSSRRTAAGETVHADGLCGLMAGGRFYLPVEGPFRPHFGLAFGPVMEAEVHDNPWWTDVSLRTTTVGLGVEAGVDFLLGGHFVVGIHAAAIARDGYRAHRSAGFSLGWAFGGR